MPIEIIKYQGKEIINFINQISAFRIAEFKKFPYLYVGTIEIEKKYLSFFAENPESLLVVAKDNDEIAGMLTGIPLSSQVVPGAKEIFQKNNLNVDDYYYWGDVIVTSKYRGLGLMKKLFHVIAQYTFDNDYKNCFMMVNREHNHPLKPKDYWSLDEILKKIGFVKTGMKVRITWPTIISATTIIEQENELTFWIDQGSLRL